MNTKTTLLVLVIALVLGATAYYTYRNTTPASSDPFDVTRSGERLFADDQLLADEIRRVELARSGDEPYVFIRTDSEGEEAVWRQVEPVPFPVDAWQIRQLVTRASDLTINATISPDELGGDLTLESLGLNPPAATLRFIGADDSEHDFSLGRIYTAGQAYLRLDPSGPVYVVNDDLHQYALQRDPMNWREMTVFEDAGVEASRVRMTRDDGSTVVINKIEGDWRMIEPVPTTVDDQAVSRLLSDIASARIASFITDAPEDLSRYGLDTPTRTLRVTTDHPTAEGEVDQVVEELQIGVPSGVAANEAMQSYYAKRVDRPTIFTVRGRTMTNVTPEASSLVSRQAVATEPENIEVVEVRGQAGAFRLERAVEGWILRPEGRDAIDADPSAVETLLSQLTMPQETIEFGALNDQITRRAEIQVDVFGGGIIATVIVAEESVAEPQATEDEPQPGPLAADEEDGAGGEDEDLFQPADDGDQRPSVRIVFADGSGVLRSSVVEEPLALNADHYRLDLDVAGPPAPGDDDDPMK